MMTGFGIGRHPHSPSGQMVHPQTLEAPRQASWGHLGECLQSQSCWQCLLTQLMPQAAGGWEATCEGTGREPQSLLPCL